MVSAVVYFIESVFDAVEKGKCTADIFIYLSKGFYSRIDIKITSQQSY